MIQSLLAKHELLLYNRLTTSLFLAAKVLRKSCPAIRGSSFSSHFALVVMSEVNVDVGTKDPTGAWRKLLV